MPLILLGLLFSSFGDLSYALIYLGIACFGLSLIFQLVTLPVEFDASHRALVAIHQCGLLTQEEEAGARKTLQAAALTYVAATATALAQLLRLILVFGNRNNGHYPRGETAPGSFCLWGSESGIDFPPEFAYNATSVKNKEKSEFLGTID